MARPHRPTTCSYRCRTRGALVDAWAVLDQLTNTDQLGEIAAAMGYELIDVEAPS